jgi:carboxyl-terminal processing protease
MHRKYPTIATALTLATACVIASFPQKLSAFEATESQRLLQSVWIQVKQNYIDGSFNNHDWEAVGMEYLDKIRNLNSEESDQAIREMLEKLGDPFTRFIDPAENKQRQQGLNDIDSYGGIGITTHESPSQPATIASVFKNSPAELAGLKPKDLILSVNGKKVTARPKGWILVATRGLIGSTALLTIQREGKILNISIVRKRIDLPPLSFQWRAKERVGYIRLYTFGNKSAQEMETAIRKLETKRPRGYILDLRGNIGGSINTSVQIGAQWLGPISVSIMRDRNNRCIPGLLANLKTCELKYERSSLSSKPLVVLVNGSTASASELLTGALQDHQRALIVGETTFGKGVAQDSFRTLNGSSLILSDSQFFTPKGRTIHEVGIKPTFPVPLSPIERQVLFQDDSKVGSREDRQYMKAVEVLLSLKSTAQKSINH